MELQERLRKMQTALNTQDNRITSYPLFCVYEKESVVTDEDYGYDEIVWFDNYAACDIDSESDKYRRLELLHKDCREYNPIRYSRCAIKYIDKFVTACFTEDGANEYLAVNKHNLNKPFIYVMSLYRNAEMIQLRDALMSGNLTATTTVKEQGK